MPFQGQIIHILISRDQWDLAKNASYGFLDFDIFHQMALLRKFYSLTLTYKVV